MHIFLHPKEIAIHQNLFCTANQDITVYALDTVVMVTCWINVRILNLCFRLLHYFQLLNDFNVYSFITVITRSYSLECYFKPSFYSFHSKFTIQIQTYSKSPCSQKMTPHLTSSLNSGL